MKAEARKVASAARKTAHEQHHDSAPLQLASHKFPASPRAGFQSVSAFYPYRSEIDTRPLLGKLAGEGWTTCLPVVVGEGLPLIFRRWLPGEPTIKAAMNIDVPLPEAPVVIPDVLIVPLLAFDKRGFRLGYGGGFYDRTIAQLRQAKTILTIGAAYAAQEIDSVPHDGHDQPLDYVMTEREVIKCG